MSPQGANTTPVTFKQDGDKVSGIFKSPQGQLPFDGGTMTGSELKFTFTINMQGMELPITLTGKVDGDEIAGKADFGGFAEGDWSAKRSAGDDDVVDVDDDHHHDDHDDDHDDRRLQRQVGHPAEDARAATCPRTRR